MKKIYILSFLFIVLLTGCSKNKYFTCNINLDNNVQNYNLDAEYKVYYKDSYVTKIEKEEVYTSKNKDTLKYFYEYKDLEYLNLNNLYGGTIYSVDLNEDKVIMKATIDMNLVDIKSMVKNNYINEDYVLINKLTISGIKSLYKSKGATCDI